jgi:hypothetical protein
MPRPTTKQELLLAGNAQFAKLWELINSMTEEQQNTAFSFEDRDRNIRDVLVHLFEWHQLLLNWTKANQEGEKKSFLPEPYNWKTYRVMNVEMIWEKHQDTPYGKSREMVKESHGEVMALIEAFSDEELFTKKYFPWTGTSSLGGYCVSVTSSHYDWAMKKIKTHAKSFKK